MERIDRKAELIRRMQEEMDHRAMVEEKAVQLITEGRHEEDFLKAIMKGLKRAEEGGGNG